MILANTDATTSAIFRPVCEDPRLEVVCVAFTQTLTRANGFWRGVYQIFLACGLGYFTYVAFCNIVFRAKEWLLGSLPGMRRLFGAFFSLRLWAREQGIQTVYSADFNSEGFLQIVRRHRPDVLFTRINQILREPILSAASQGCWCFHSSALPSYQGIAAEFHSLLNGEGTAGFTVFRMERIVDAGPILAIETFPVPPGVTLHGLIEHTIARSHGVVRRAIEAMLSGEVMPIPQDLSQRSYYSWPNPVQTRAFRRRGLRYISMREAFAYVCR